MLARGPARRGAGTVGRGDRGPHTIRVGPDLRQHLAHRAARLQQRRQHELLGGKAGASFTGLLGRRLDEALGVRGVGELLRGPARPAAAAAGFEPLARSLHVEAQALEHRPAGAVGADQRQHDVLGSDRVVLQPDRLGPGAFQGALRAGAQRMGIDAGRRSFLAQSGFASSTSMMGMPSSTA